MGLKYTRMAKKFVWMGDKMKAIVVTKEPPPSATMARNT